MSYEIAYTKAAEKFFRKHEDVRDEYESAIKELMTGETGKQLNIKRIRGKRNEYYRIRLGDWRVIYAVINGKIVVVQTLLAGARGDVYKKKYGLR